MTLSAGPGNQALFSSFTDYFADAIFIVRCEPGDLFVISYASHSFLKKINKTFDEVINVEIAQVFPVDEAAVLRINMINCIAQGTENNFKYVSAITGKNACLAVQLFPVLYNGKKEQLACILKDITGINCTEDNNVTNKLLVLPEKSSSISSQENLRELHIAAQNKQLKELLEVQEKQKEEIRETKNILQAAINSSSDIIAFLDANHNKVFCNIATEQFAMKYWNCSVKVGDNLFDFLPKKLHHTFRRNLEKAEANKVLNIEKMFRLPDNTYAWFSIRFFPTFDNKDNYIGSFINVCDVTQRKNSELRLRRQNEELRIKSNAIKEIKSQLESLINSSSDYIILLDEDMKVVLYNTTANEASLNYLKKPYSKGISLIDFLPIENRENTAQYIQQVKETGKPVFIETRFVLSEDSKRWLYAKFFPVYNEAGRYDGCAVISTDITAIKEKEFQIEQQNELLRNLIELQERQNEQLKANELEIMETKNQMEAIINSSSDNILFIDTNNKVIFFNRAASNHFLKLSNEPLKHGRNILHYVPKEKHETFRQSLEKIQGKKTLELEEEEIYPDGDRVWFYRKYYPIYNQKSEYIGYVLNSVNINKRKLFELKLFNQNEQLREIARIQSHELRRPLANILGLINLLTEEHIDSADRNIFFSKLKLSAEELDNVIKKITDKTIS